MEGLIIFIKFDLQNKDKVTQLRTSYTVLVAVRARTPTIGLSFQQKVGHFATNILTPTISPLFG